MTQLVTSVFTIPFDPRQETFHDEQLQYVLKRRRVKSVTSEFVQKDGKVCWRITVQYERVLRGPKRRDALDKGDRSR
jgi:hypothetical protein